MIYKAISIFLAIVLLYSLVLLSYLYNSPLSYSEIDLNSNGIIGFTEASYSSEIEQREVTILDKKCKEYYHLKDGLTGVVKCYE